MRICSLKSRKRQVRKLNSLVNKTINRNNGIRSTGRNHNNGLGLNSQMQGSVSNNQTGNLNSNSSKWVINVVMDKEDYIQKAEELLAQPAYRKLDRDPTNRIKVKCITKLRTIKKDTRLDEGMYKIMYPTSCVPPKFYGLPKIHKTGTPLRPIVSSRVQSPMG